MTDIMDERDMDDEERQTNVNPDGQIVDGKYLGEECNIFNYYDVLQKQLRSVGLILYSIGNRDGSRRHSTSSAEAFFQAKFPDDVDTEDE